VITTPLVFKSTNRTRFVKSQVTKPWIEGVWNARPFPSVSLSNTQTLANCGIPPHCAYLRAIVNHGCLKRLPGSWVSETFASETFAINHGCLRRLSRIVGVCNVHTRFVGTHEIVQTPEPS
jgi:hypothetical protein